MSDKKIFQAGSKEHVISAGKRWFLHKETYDKVCRTPAFSDAEKDVIITALASRVDEAEQEFWDAARLAIEQNVCVPPRRDGVIPKSDSTHG
jgi:hypothetical protein